MADHDSKEEKSCRVYLKCIRYIYNCKKNDITGFIVGFMLNISLILCISKKIM